MKTTLSAALAAPLMGLALVTFGASSQAASFTEGFDGASLPAGWVTANLSDDAADGSLWSTTSGFDAIVPQAGAGFAAADYTSTGADEGDINNWLISPEIVGLKNGDTFSFYTTTIPGSIYPDRLEFRLSTAGAGTDVGATTTSVGSFTTLLASVNPSLAVGGYPEGWTLVTVTVSGLTGSVDGRVGFRYFVSDGGSFGANSNVIGVDSFSYVAAAVPEPETWALLMGGLGVLGWAAKRKAARQA